MRQPQHLAFFIFLAGWAAAAAAGLLSGLALTLSLMAGFDVAAVLFLGFKVLRMRNAEVDAIRLRAAENDASRGVLLVIAFLVVAVILVAVGYEIDQRSGVSLPALGVTVATLVLAWLFSNLVYALHYAHMFYDRCEGEDRGGLDFPGTKEPDYWDFYYFAFVIGATFQVSDVQITASAIRRVVLWHSLSAFFFSIGVVALTVNVLGGLS